MPVLGSYSSPQPSVAHGKRKADQVSFRSFSPPRTRIKSERSDSPTRAYRESSAFEEFVRDLTPLANKIDRDARRADARRATASLDVDPSEAKKVLILDPRNKDYFWQIRCLSKGFLRNRICSYWGLGSVQALRTWEEANSLRWTHIQLWLSMPHVKVMVIDMLRIVCNDGGSIADVLAYMEYLKPWNWPTGASFNANAGTVALALTVDIPTASATLQMACIIVWMIRDSPKQFRNSNHFGTKFFWYSPENINRAFWYLSNLVAQPIDRMTNPDKRSQDVKMGVDAGKASLHNSVLAGKWSKHVPASKIHTIHCRVQEEGNGGRPSFLPDAVDGRGTPVDSSNESAAVQDLAVTAPQNQTSTAQGLVHMKEVFKVISEKQKDEMKADIANLRKWASGALRRSDKMRVDKELDGKLTAARIYIKNVDKKSFIDACSDVGLFMWKKLLPDTLSVEAEGMFQEFEKLHAWPQEHPTTDPNDAEVDAVLQAAITAINSENVFAFYEKCDDLKEIVCNKELGV
jgi:hypothetical protein